MSKNKSRAVKVTLRFRMLPSGKETLYLDFYPPIKDPETGQPSRREYLGILVEPLKNRKGEYIFNKDKTTDYKYKYSQSDLESIQTAQTICSSRQIELSKAYLYTDSEKEMLKARERGKCDFVEFFVGIANEKKTSNHDNWLSALAHLKNYIKLSDNTTSIRFCDITLEWCNGFKNYLLTTQGRNGKPQLKTNTASSYLVKFKIALKAAFKYGYLTKDLNSDITGIKEEETKREFLSIEELRKLAETPCNDEVLKRAALFSSLTGLRHSDIRKMVWKEITESNGEFTLKYTMQKTGKYSEMPLNNEAVELCGERNSPDKLVFEGLRAIPYGSRDLAQWLGAAGITRNITFHCFRHTFATLQLERGTQITTIQKLLGHKDIGTTLIYAKTLDKAKREAVNKLTLKED